jgi:hypothetical protein
MPATLLSHQALVLPLKLQWPARFSGIALCIGSMAPDLEFIGRLHDDWLVSHTVWAQFWFTIPLTALLVWVTSVLLIPALLPYVPDHAWWRPHDLAAIRPPRTAREWARVAISAWMGGMSHVVLDGVTHGNHSGWLVPMFPVLRTPVPHFGGTVPLHDALQLWCSVIFAVVTLVLWRRMVRQRALWHWRSPVRANAGPFAEHRLPRMPRQHGLWIIRLLVVVATLGAATGHRLRAHDGAKTALAGTAFGGITFTLGAAVLLAVALRWHRERARGLTA